jgi:hypothetical protein
MNPDGAVKDFKYLSEVFAGYPGLPEELGNLLCNMSGTIKQAYGPAKWQEFLMTIEPNSRQALIERFGY